MQTNRYYQVPDRLPGENYCSSRFARMSRGLAREGSGTAGGLHRVKRYRTTWHGGVGHGPLSQTTVGGTPKCAFPGLCSLRRAWPPWPCSVPRLLPTPPRRLTAPSPTSVRPATSPVRRFVQRGPHHHPHPGGLDDQLLHRPAADRQRWQDLRHRPRSTSGGNYFLAGLEGIVDQHRDRRAAPGGASSRRTSCRSRPWAPRRVPRCSRTRRVARTTSSCTTPPRSTWFSTSLVRPRPTRPS